MKKIKLEKLKSLIDRKVSFILLDVVVPESHAKEHIPTALSACVYEIAFLDHVRSIIKDPLSAIVVYATKSRSRAASLAAERLLRAGYKDVLLFEGGLEEWKAAGYGTESADAGSVEIPKMENKEYAADTLDSVVYWTARSVASRHTGTLAISRGGFKVENGEIISGEFVIDMNSIKDTDLEDPKWNDILIGHLKSEDFFEVEKYPESSLRIRSVSRKKGADDDSPHRKVVADMTIKGVTHEIAFDALIEAKEGGVIKARLHFDFDRTKWNVLYGSEKFFERLGMHLVDEAVSLDAAIIAK